MAKKAEKLLDKSSDEGGMFFQEILPKLKRTKWVERSVELMQENPGATLAIAVGVGVVLGATMFSRMGRIVFISALGVGAEIAMRRVKSSFFDGFASEPRPA